MTATLVARDQSSQPNALSVPASAAIAAAYRGEMDRTTSQIAYADTIAVEYGRWRRPISHPLASHGSEAITGYSAGGATVSHQGWTISRMPIRITIDAKTHPVAIARSASHLWSQIRALEHAKTAISACRQYQSGDCRSRYSSIRSPAMAGSPQNRSTSHVAKMGARCDLMLILPLVR